MTRRDKWLTLMALEVLVILLALIAVRLLMLPAHGAPKASHDSYLPNHELTPGVANPMLNKAKICDKAFRTSAVRDVDDATKAKVCTEYGLEPHCDANEAYEIDHLIDIDNGGSNDIKNLWPQNCSGPNNCHDKDKLEVRLHDLVCAGKVDYRMAQQAIATNWLAAYSKYVHERP